MSTRRAVASSHGAITEVVVVIPARDEDQLVARCLQSVTDAADRVDVPVQIILVADGCLDNTARVARRFEAVHVIEIDSSNVGTARATGVDFALGRASNTLSRVWIANTDADSYVPPSWLQEHLRLADSGVDVVVGTVRPDFADLSFAQVQAWTATHPAGVANGHVHGANLGIRASTYRSAGGFETAPEHEDVELVRRAGSFAATAGCEVVTSGRQVGRTPGGYARYLREDVENLAARESVAQQRLGQKT